MEKAIVKKNDLRWALIDLYYSVIRTLDESSKNTRLKEFKSTLQRLSNEIKVKYRESPHKDIIRKVFKTEVKYLLSLAEEVAEGNRFNHGKFIFDLFDGIPLMSSPLPHRAYDLVIKLDAYRSKALIFAPSTEDGSDLLRAQIEAEQDFELPCIKVDIRRQVPEVEQHQKLAEEIKGASVEAATESTMAETVTVPEQTATPGTEILGRVLFSRKDQFNLRAEQDKDEIKGFILEEHVHMVKPLDILVLENPDCRKKIYAYATKIDMNPISGAGYVRQFSELATHVLFRPIMEVSSDYKGRVRPSDLTGFVIRKPMDSELVEVLNIPQRGLPLGWLDYNDTDEVFRYPEDTIYQSLMIAGVQGKGKSNALKLLLRTVSANSQVELLKRPAIIILDGEGEYKKFTKKTEMSKGARQFLDKYGIGDVEPIVYTINSDPAKSDATLSLRGIDRQDLIYLMPELESRTENILLVLLNHVSRILDYEKAPQDIETLRNRLISEANSSGLIHMQQRPAIARAVLSPSLNLLDQKGKTPLTPGLLFKPGTVSVIDYQGLDQNKKRVVALYLLQMLSRFKMDAPNYDPGVLLVIDEAELLFPANPSKGDKDYALRIESRMEDITNRGRKHKYGVVLVTHLPSEVSQKVGDLANTKIAFGCSGANKWIRDHFGKDYVTEINTLPTGVCRITIKIDTGQQGPINARVRVPFVGMAEDLASNNEGG